jgi:hypothetical protein
MSRPSGGSGVRADCVELLGKVAYIACEARLASTHARSSELLRLFQQAASYKFFTNRGQPVRVGKRCYVYNSQLEGSMKTIAVALIASSALMAPMVSFADVNGDNVTTKKVKKTYVAPNGNTVDVVKAGQADGEGNARGVRAFRVTDEDGDVVRRGVDRARKTDDGKVARAKKREFTDADGNVYQKRARAQKDGEGNARAQRQGRRLDADGNVTGRASDRVRKSADGDFARKSNKRWVDANGNRHAVKRVRKSHG